MAVRSPLRRRRPEADGEGGTPEESVAYDGFISYSHAVDGKLAPALQAGLQRFSKPWYRLRALRVFRDNASLSANPALWTSIEGALGGSRWFILLASPGSAQSHWVAREVGTWLGRHGTQRLLIAVTDGELSWDEEANAFEGGPNAAAPEALRTAFDEEPRYIDLRWAQTADHLSLSDPRFRDAVADLAAPIHDRPKDDLVGEEVRQHRRAVRLARAGVTALALLLAAATAAALLAVSQRNEARTQRDRAETQARIATSRQLAAQATAVRDEQYDLALLLAAEAYRTQGTPEARSALMSTLEGNPQLVTFVGTPAPQPGPTPGPAALSPDGNLLAVAGADEVGLWDTATHRLVRRLDPAEKTPLGLATKLAFSDDGRLVAAAWVLDKITVWDTATGEVTRSLETPDAFLPRSLAFAPGGSYLAAGYSRPEQIAVWRLDGDGDALTIPTRLVDYLSIDTASNTVTGGGSDGRTARFDLRTAERVERHAASRPSFTSSVVYADDGRRYAIAERNGDVTIYQTDSEADPAHLAPGQQGGYPTMVFSRDGKTLAAAGGGIATVWRLDKPETQVNLQGFSGATTDVTLSGDGTKLAVSGGPRVVLFDLERRFRLADEVLDPDVGVPPFSVGLPAALAFSDNGRFVAWLHPQTLVGGGLTPVPKVLVRDLRDGLLKADIPLVAPDSAFTLSAEGPTVMGTYAANALALSPDGSLLAVGGRRVEIHALPGGEPRLLAESDKQVVQRLQFSRDGSLLTVVWADGAVARYDVDTAEPVVEVAPTFPAPVIAVGHHGSIVRLLDSNAGAVVESNLDESDPELQHVSEGANGAAVAAVGPGAVRALAFSDGRVGVGGGDIEGFRFQLAGTPTSLAFDAGGTLLAAAASNGTLSLWDLEAKVELARLAVRDLGDWPVVAAFRPGSTPLLAIAAVDGSLTLWQVGVQAALAQACRVASRNLTQEEWDRYLGLTRPREKTCAAYPLDTP